MSPPVARLALAENKAAAARLQLNRDLAELQQRLAPRLLARAASQQGREVGLAGLETARRNPAVLAGAATLVAGLLLRGPIRRMLRRRRKVPAAPISHNDPSRTQQGEPQ